MKKFLACALALVMLCGLACAESFDISTTNVNTDPASAYMCDITDYESVTFTFEFADGGWGGGCVGYNSATAEDPANAWTAVNWQNDGELTVTVNNADVLADENGKKIVQVQTWWDASADGFADTCTVTLGAAIGGADETPDAGTDAPADGATDEQPATGDATSIVLLAGVAVLAMVGVVASKKRA